MRGPRSTALVLAVSALVFLPTSAVYAEDQGTLRTSSLSWSNANSLAGTFTGGTPRQFEPDQTGWTSGPFTEVGRFGVARTINGGSVRDEFESWNQTVTIEQGGTHSMVLDGVIIVSTLKRVTAEPTITASGSSLHADIHLEDFWADSLPGLRMYWQADFAAGSSISYRSPEPGVLIASDSAGEYSTVVLHAYSSAGVPGWRGRDWYEDPLLDGDPEATLWIPDIPGSSLDVDIDAFIIDYDPCGAEDADTLAEAIAVEPMTYRGNDLDLQSGCVTTTAFSYTTQQDEPQVFDLSLDESVNDPEGSTRTFSLGGIPSFLDVTVDTSSTPATISMSSSGDETTGDYSLTLDSWLEPSGESQPQSAPLSASLTLSVSDPTPPAPAPVPAPEPVTPAASATSEDDDDEDSKDTEFVAVEVLPGPTPVAIPEVETAPLENTSPNSPELSEPDFQLQESEPPTPLPSEPPPVASMSDESGGGFWAGAWWLWLALGVGLLWWGLVWFAPRLPWSHSRP